MSIVDFLFGKSFGDEMFGKLHFNRMSFQHYWQGKVKFVPTNSEIDIYLIDVEDKVFEEHKKFYKELEKRYPKIKEEIINILDNPPQAMGYLPHTDFDKFILIGLSFPTVKELQESSFQWDMYFSYDNQKPSFSVGMENWKPDKDECFSGE
jgi:hypothetical protein